MIGRRLISALVAVTLALLQPLPGVALCFCAHGDAIGGGAPHGVESCRAEMADRGGAPCDRAETPRACCEPDGVTRSVPPNAGGVLTAGACTAALGAGTDLPDVTLPGADPLAPLAGVVTGIDAPARPAGASARPLAAAQPRAGPVPLYTLTAAYLI